MYSFILNGQPTVCDKEINLLEYLRDYARLTSVKNGCAEGACGACMVLLDGKATRACLLTTAKVNGKKLLTVEGLSEQEKNIYSWAFATAGAVQCGFCIPGMVISAKGLIDTTPEPASDQVKKALHGNVCRCTGYVKIEKAVLMAAKALREGFTPPAGLTYKVGDRMPRVDAKAKTLGTAEYVDDMYVEGMLHAAILRAPTARALIKKIDTAAALALPGVEAVITAKDIPGRRHQGHIIPDWPAFIAEGEETRYIGDALAAVAATSKQIAQEAVRLIKVDYEELTPLTSPRQALAEDAPRLHPQGNILARTVLKRGNVEKAIAKAKQVVTHCYKTPFTEHAFLEPESALAVPQPDGTLTVYISSQNVYDDYHGIVSLLGVKEKDVRVVSKMVGGGFGGKEDLTVQHHAALLAWHTKKPVKNTLSRQESIKVHPKRHAMEMNFTTACDENGIITAMKAEITADTGAYASLGGPVLQRACTHAAGPYQIPNVDIVGLGVYTNNPPAGAFRGFGVTQSCFAMENNINIMAAKVGISQWEMRWRNAIEPDKILPNGQIADQGTALKETLLAVRKVFEASPYAGLACAMKNAGIGVGLPDIGRVKIKIENGKAVIYTGAACIGQGLVTVMIQILSETTGIASSQIAAVEPDTDLTPDSGTTTASRQTVFTGEATRRAALKLREELATASLDELEGREFYGEYSGVTDPMGSDKPNPVSHVAYGYATHVVILDEAGKLVKVVAAHDVGKAINPTGVEGQIEGGIVMGLGYALTEDFPLKDGIPQVKFGTLGLFRAGNVPEIESIIVGKNQAELAYGAKGVGEITAIPIAPAVAGAYMRKDGKVRTELPLSATPYSRKK
ncbi:selenium-dependent xanthine dehydrogenase [Sporomusa acidovorans]|uniref:2Fe-2S ferredoxin-type domain-containing protein n=1 Tax=Sporomusa acidovorans (strain ATCC 49682 / DSM 3132 / Mol) TaxID=1123286 RepID=A0ABZ3J617_SPOA4|nr:selenium-dependent xanthine dehydrogenase [Sporomusa acidovorans]OZC15681.1 putative xanthine dehydrogenase subunit D [Sporomusa acidovorans DSM 3132]SDE88801.1 selenium-dependent xanthine dehydrogenase [Sporomusa acidovorans]